MCNLSLLTCVCECTLLGFWECVLCVWESVHRRIICVKYKCEMYLWYLCVKCVCEIYMWIMYVCQRGMFVCVRRRVCTWIDLPEFYFQFVGEWNMCETYMWKAVVRYICLSTCECEYALLGFWKCMYGRVRVCACVYTCPYENEFALIYLRVSLYMYMRICSCVYI